MDLRCDQTFTLRNEHERREEGNCEDIEPHFTRIQAAFEFGVSLFDEMLPSISFGIPVNRHSLLTSWHYVQYIQYRR